LDAYSDAFEQKCENIGFYKKLVDKEGNFIAGVIADADKGESGFVNALFVEEPLRHKGLGTYLLKKAEEFAKENGASVVMTNAGDWNVEFFKKNGYLLRGELKDVPKGHDCFELYKMI
ncbi:MAG: GNAT family N-acetyltransferase, partial [Clostridia bacterium]|nr:GNAT family N-acetyltransferase [Clostridia bacterium]